MLTKLPNRLLILDHLLQAMHEALRSGDKIVVMFLDFDGFKQVNDSCGHDAGDAILREVACRLTQVIRLEDTAARIGGDEFILVLNNIKKRNVVERIGKDIIHLINQPVVFNQLSLKVGVSIGVSCFPADGNDADSLINVADSAMYQVKQSGKNRMLMTCVIND